MTRKAAQNEDRFLPYRELLTEARDQMVDQIRSLSKAGRSVNRQAGEELADIGSDDFIRETDLSLAGVEHKTYLLIQEAIERFDEGTYGTCIDCGADIGEGRLKAIPYAKLCVNCKQVREANDGQPPEEVIDSDDADLLVE